MNAPIDQAGKKSLARAIDDSCLEGNGNVDAFSGDFAIGDHYRSARNGLGGIARKDADVAYGKGRRLRLQKWHSRQQRGGGSESEGGRCKAHSVLYSTGFGIKS